MEVSGAIAKPKSRSIGADLFDIAKRIGLVGLAVTTVLSLLYFPWSTDNPLTPAEQLELEKYYASAYEEQGAIAAEENEDSAYVRIAKAAAEEDDIKGKVLDFSRTYGLTEKKVLDIGAGRGYLQDVLNDYTALDISPTAKRFFHKAFVLGTATHMPFKIGEFDAAWSIWVLEHIPNRESALVEMRRVIKDGGLLYLAPAWNCSPLRADGYPVRPYSDFGLAGKLIKASIPAQVYFSSISTAPVRLIRYTNWKVTASPMKFRYHRLVPNYQQYWMADSDAVNSLDRYETALWFRSRGDECLNCKGALEGFFEYGEPLIIRIHKTGAGAS
jgi:ubiquinone/menaquinone biosynthesis C-methylase UbiE